MIEATTRHGTDSLAVVPFGAPVSDVINFVARDGGVIIENVINADQVAAINAEIDEEFERVRLGSEKTDEFQKTFHGNITKRLASTVLYSRTYREAFIDNDVTLSYIRAMFDGVCQTFWLNASQAIEIHPGETAQPLHRDMGNYPVFYQYGAAAPEVMANLLLALCDVTEEIGATRVIPGSHRDSNFAEDSDPALTVPAELRAGSALLIGGKVVHGGGANVSGNRKRRVVATAFCPGFLVPEDAYPFVIPLDEVRQLSPRLQQLLGFRSFHQRNPLGGSLWQVDCEELANHLNL